MLVEGQTGSATRTKYKLRNTLLLLLGSIVIAVLVLETGLRVLDIQHPSPAVPDTLIGWRFKPGASYVFKKEGFSEGRINSLGLRDVEHEYRKPADVYRILFLGDSYVEALQVDLDSCFAKRVEEVLSARIPGGKFETVNTGRSGMGTAEELLFFTSEGHKYSPDLVVLVFSPNDYRDNSKELDTHQSIRPYFIDRGAGLELDTSFTDTRGFKIRKLLAPFKNRSSLISLAIEIYYAIRERGAAPPKEPGERQGEAAAPAPSVHPGANLFVKQPTPRWERTYKLTLELLRMTKDAVEATGARFALVSIPTAMQSQEPKRTEAERLHP